MTRSDLLENEQFAPSQFDVPPTKIAERFAVNLNKKCKICKMNAVKKILGCEKSFTAKNRNSYKKSLPLSAPLILQSLTIGIVALKNTRIALNNQQPRIIYKDIIL